MYMYNLYMFIHVVYFHTYTELFLTLHECHKCMDSMIYCSELALSLAPRT